MNIMLVFVCMLFCTAVPHAANASEGQNKAVSEFAYTDDEREAIAKWNCSSHEALVKEAHNGDVGGLYVLGMTYLMGQNGNSINVDRAHFYFAAAASLGFAPALDKVKFKCQWTEENIFLTLVYLNLTASAGHPEYVMAYHKQRNELATRYGQHYAKEVERIASDKIAMIAKNIEKMKTCADKSEFIRTELFMAGNIVKDDVLYNNEYWKSLK